MISYFRNFFILVALFVLAGCATGPKMQEIKSSIPAISEGTGRIYFYRKAVFFGDGLQPTIYLNGEKVGKAVPKGFFYVDRPAGDYEVSTSTEVKRQVSFQLNPGEEKYVRFNIALGVVVGRVLPVLIGKEQALVELENTRLIEPSEEPEYKEPGD